MRRSMIVILALMSGLLLISVVYAHPPGNKYGRCISQVAGPGPGVLTEFQKEILPLREKLIGRRMEVRNEYFREKPDRDRIALLKKEIIDIRTEIMKKADEAGVPAMKNKRFGCGRMWGRSIINKCGW